MCNVLIDPHCFSFGFRRTRYKQIVVCFQFPDGYPKTNVMVELKSHHVSEKLLDGLTKLAHEEARKHLGKPQVSSFLFQIAL